MARPPRPWFRFYVEAFNDRKLRRLTPTQRWVWVAVLGAARDSCVPGELFIAPGIPMTHSELAEFAGVKEREIVPALEAMETLGMVTVNGVVSVTNWSGRQYESDDVTKRVRAYRERSKEPDSNVSCNAPDTETDTDTDIEGDKRRGKRAIPTPFVVPPEKVADWQQRFPHVDIDLEMRKLVNWAKAGDKRYADWLRVADNWVIRASEGGFK